MQLFYIIITKNYNIIIIIIYKNNYEYNVIITKKKEQKSIHEILNLDRILQLWLHAKIIDGKQHSSIRIIM